MSNFGGVYMIQIGERRVKVGQSMNVSQRLTEHATIARNYAGFESKRKLVALCNATGDGPRVSERKLLRALIPFSEDMSGQEFLVIDWDTAEQVFRSTFSNTVRWN